MPTQILIVEDDEDTLELLSLVFVEAGFGVRTAKNGQDGLDHALAKAPHVILTDIVLPGLDGVGMARALRGDGRTNGIRIVAFTGSMMPFDRSLFDAVFLKPTGIVDLLRGIHAVLGVA